MTPSQLQAKLNQAASSVASAKGLIARIALSVEGKAKRLAPVRTGTLRRSITSRVETTRGYVGSNVEYAPFVEYGTRYMEAQPFLEPAIDEARADIEGALRDFGGGIWRKVAG